MRKKIASAAIQCLKEALSVIYWYKSDLRSFLTHTLSDSSLLGCLNWSDYKRNIVSTLIDYLAKNEDKYQQELLHLMYEVSSITDFSHLRRLDDGKEKERRARESVIALKKQMEGHLALLQEDIKKEKRRARAYKRIMAAQAVKEKLNQIKEEFFIMLRDVANPQQRGYTLEKILQQLFELFDLDPKASFKVVGEQIDGAFSFEGTDYLLEAKWQKEPVRASQIDSLTAKLNRKLDNTLGLFLSINGFSEEAVKAVSSGRRLVILMDGSDLMAVLEGRIDLVELLLRKRRKAAETGNIYLKIYEILSV
ncbi:MAG: restriction endonuclease [Chlorobi bacterium]|nr:restriction endonuclease [Chlorobiota bacterium]